MLQYQATIKIKTVRNSNYFYECAYWQFVCTGSYYCNLKISVSVVKREAQDSDTMMSETLMLNIDMNILLKWIGGLNWINLTQDGDKW
jgi:hypothetical protein